MLRLLGLALVALLALASAHGWRLPAGDEAAPALAAAAALEPGDRFRPAVDLVLEYVPPPPRATPPRGTPARRARTPASAPEPATGAPTAPDAAPSDTPPANASAEVERLRRLLAIYERVAR